MSEEQAVLAKFTTAHFAFMNWDVLCRDFMSLKEKMEQSSTQALCIFPLLNILSSQFTTFVYHSLPANTMRIAKHDCSRVLVCVRACECVCVTVSLVSLRVVSL